MKYIRTPFTIFEVVAETDVIYRVKAKWTPDHTYSKSKSQTDVIASADTIEELIDEYIEQYEDDKNVIHKNKLFSGEDGSWRRNIGLPEHKIKIYGAIWTDKGLIYVAQLNDKGELELL